MKTQSKVINFRLDNNIIIPINITKKRMKNIRLTISKAGEVNVSMPLTSTYSYAYEFLSRKREWLNQAYIKINDNLSKNTCRFEDNGTIFFLGKCYTLSLVKHTKNIVEFNGKFTIYAQDLSPEYIEKIYIKWCKKHFLAICANRLKFIYTQMYKDDNVPTIKLKTMKSMWGNCNFVKRTICFNLFLSKTSIECVDYVITHELAHLKYHNHGKEFHSYLSALMPDWKQRKKLLNTYPLKF